MMAEKRKATGFKRLALQQWLLFTERFIQIQSKINLQLAPVWHILNIYSELWKDKVFSHLSYSVLDTVLL